MCSGRYVMLTYKNVFLDVQPVDMRRGIGALMKHFQDELKSSSHEGAAFIFTDKAHSRIKVLRWDKHGVWLCVRVRTKDTSSGLVLATKPGLTLRISSVG